MRILMLGNSFTYFNDMPEILAALTGWEVVSHTRGGAYLSEHLDPEAEMGRKTLRALQSEKWDIVILQEQSRAPFAARDEFLKSVRELCPLVRKAGATPLLYATWAYRDGTEKLAETGLSYNAMLNALCEGYEAAAAENGIPVAHVGKAFAAAKQTLDLYVSDDYHPSAAGSLLAAETLIQRIRQLIRETSASV